MAKDPAMLWYWNDWTGGTMTLTRHQKGCYIDLLAAQFNQGPLSLEQVKTLLGTDQASWTVLQAKFIKKVNSDGIEVFFNERMETEKKKRRAFSDKQTEKVNKRWQKDTGVYTGVVPKIENANGNEIENENSFGKSENLFSNAEEIVLANQIEFERICMTSGKTAEFAKECLRNYHLHLEENAKYPKTRRAIFAGFEKWLRNEKKFINGTHQQSPGDNYTKFGKAAGAIRAGHDLSKELGIDLT